MVPINRANLRQQAVTLLRARILSGELEPDSVYSAIALASDLGVSPTPIREAMLDLANEGLVEVLPNKGYRLTTPTDKDLDEIVELRLLLEVPTLANVIEIASDADLARLDQPVTACISAASARDLTAFLLADREFHLELVAISGNNRLSKLVASLRDQTRLLGLKQLSDHGELGDAAEEHAHILSAVKARDVTRAEDLMRGHLDHTRGIWAGHTDD
jgi:DNA-binding GntR family transcriptional regulator